MHELRGLEVALSEPVLVGRSKGYFWFPTLLRLSDGRLMAVMSAYADVHVAASTAAVCLSGDGGLTWSRPTSQRNIGPCHLRLPSGDELLLPYYLYPGDGGLVGPYSTLRRGSSEPEHHDRGVSVTGWPRKDRSFAPDLGLAGFVLNGQVVALKDGRHLTTLYGHFEGAQRYSLVAADSSDGLAWKVRAVIADETCRLPGGEGPCESAVCRLSDGRLMCIFRLSGGAKYGQTFSRDEGRTWSEPAAMADAFSVEPSLAVMSGGTVVLSGGRPGLFLWFNPDGDGKDWQRVNLMEHHNACRPDQAITDKTTSAYTEVVALDDTHLLCIYDRIPCGWNAIPADSDQTNSVWVVRITVPRAPVGARATGPATPGNHLAE